MSVPKYSYSLRSRPRIDLSAEEVKGMLEKYDFVCRRHLFSLRTNNPKGAGIRHGYELEKSNLVVFDYSTGLHWQRDGSPDAFNFGRASHYISEINQQGYAGYNDWRLPTLEEAMSLMEPEIRNGDNYTDPIFDQWLYTIWTCDIRGGSKLKRLLLGLGVWVAVFDGGICYPLGPANSCPVQAVRSS